MVSQAKKIINLEDQVLSLNICGEGGVACSFQAIHVI